MAKFLIFLLFVTICVFLCLVATDELFSQRGMKVIKVHTETGNEIELYKDSYALVVGNGNYTAGWNPLRGAIQDVDAVAAALKKHGFTVTLKKDLTKPKFEDAFEKFVTAGRNENNRLLFYYAGHGHTEKLANGEDLGYLIMVDARPPENNHIDHRKSVDMESLVTQAKRIRARHVLFMFDSCFSGAILNVDRNLEQPKGISSSIRQPVRQFITAGSANEGVPDKSRFRVAFLNLIEGRARQPVDDDYVTGEELGFYLKHQVPTYNKAQHPQYGKINDPNLDQGDFVFVLPPKEPPPPPPPPPVEEWETMATLTVTSTPSGADIYINNTLIGKTPLIDYKVDTGVRREKQVEVGLELLGYKSRVAKLTLKGGEKTPWDVRLEKFSPQTATLTVTSTPSGADIYINNTLIGKTPLINYKIDTGVRREKQVEVGLELSGYESRVAKLTLKGGEKTPWDVRLEELIPQTATLTIISTPSGASVYVDGVLIGPTPLHDYEINTGMAHEKQIEVELKLSGYKSRVAKLALRDGRSTSWEEHLEKIPQTQPETVPPEGMVLIPAGEFQMGSRDGEFDEKPVHTVYVDAFYMDIYEVTNAQYKKFVDANPEWGKDHIPTEYHDGSYLKHWSGNSYGRKNYPVVYVSWYGAMAYAQWAGKRLPTEAEWEKAARGGLLGKKYPWGNSLDSSKAKYRSADDRSGDATAVGTYLANGYGLYDMAGNVWEWCLDGYDGGFYKSSPHRNPIARADSITQVTANFIDTRAPRVLRGGASNNSHSNLRVANRRGFNPVLTDKGNGFRCVKAVSP